MPRVATGPGLPYYVLLSEANSMLRHYYHAQNTLDQFYTTHHVTDISR